MQLLTISLVVGEQECLVFLKRASGAAQDRAVKRVFNFYTPCAPIAKIALDHLAQIAEAEHHMSHALLAQPFQLMGQKGFARNRQEHFGNFLCKRAEACGQAAGEDGDWEGICGASWHGIR